MGQKEILLAKVSSEGIIDAGEDSVEGAACGSLREEAGHSTSNIQQIGAVYDNPTKKTPIKSLSF